MDHDFRSVLEAELAGHPEPPLGNLVESSVRRGRRLRTVRRLQLGGAAVALVGVVVVAVVASGGRVPWAPAGRGGFTQQPAAGTPATTSAATPGAAPTSSPADPLVPATPAGALELLLSLLPPGRTSHYAGTAEPGLDLLQIQTYLDTGSGPGMLRLNVDTQVPVTGGHPPAGVVRRPLPDGNIASVLQLPGNCVQRTVVEVTRPNGDVVQINIANCLVWNGNANPPAPPVLTVQQAIAIADDPRWGAKLPKSLVDAGEARFPHLPDFG